MLNADVSHSFDGDDDDAWPEDSESLPPEPPRSPAAPVPPPPPEPVESLTDRPAIMDLVRDISNDVRNAKDLDPVTRQECVLALSLDGFTNEDIACLLRISERTVSRDRKAARKLNALQPDCSLGDELLGELQEYAMTSIRRLTKMCSDTSTPPAVRLRADEAIARIYGRFVDQVRRFSYAQDGMERLARQSEEREQAKEEELPPDASYERRLQFGIRRMTLLAKLSSRR